MRARTLNSLPGVLGFMSDTVNERRELHRSDRSGNISLSLPNVINAFVTF